MSVRVAGRRRRWVRVVIVALLAVQVGFAVNGYRDPHQFFAFQPFNESSTWQADIVRVTWSGERIAVSAEWSGYHWNELVDVGALRNPGGLRHASYGAAATVDFLADALDWVATHTPADEETRYLEATVTVYENTRGPEVTVLRSVERPRS